MTTKKDTKERDARDDGPRQTVRRMPEEENVGPYFPSGMSAPEAALAGATATLTDEEIKTLKGNTPDDQEALVKGDDD